MHGDAMHESQVIPGGLYAFATARSHSSAKSIRLTLIRTAESSATACSARPNSQALRSLALANAAHPSAVSLDRVGRAS